MAVNYYTEECSLRFANRRTVNRWIAATAEAEGRKRGEITVIFCPDAYLLKINREHLGHDHYTDIITFDYSEGDVISGDLFISVDTVRRNATAYGEDFGRELHRVIIHGILHLCGYKDKTTTQARQMREKEDLYLGRLEGDGIKDKRHGGTDR